MFRLVQEEWSNDGRVDNHRTNANRTDPSDKEAPALIPCLGGKADFFPGRGLGDNPPGENGRYEPGDRQDQIRQSAEQIKQHHALEK